MVNQGCASGFHSHNILINGHCKSRRIHEAITLFAEISMYSSAVSMLMDLVSDGTIILCFCDEVLKMGISIEISFSAQQCCGGLSSKQPLEFFLKFDDRDHVALQNTDSHFCISITVSCALDTKKCLGCIQHLW
ncbi:hypothetical protein Peur_004888 [Populus x canadensis]